MKAFPRLVKMHKEYADKGLVVIAVSVDDATKPERVKIANDFLKEANPPFINLLLDVPDDYWSKKLGFTFPPCYFVFDRNGRWVRFPEDGEDDYYDKRDNTIIQMLNAK